MMLRENKPEEIQVSVPQKQESEGWVPKGKQQQGRSRITVTWKFRCSYGCTETERGVIRKSGSPFVFFGGS